MHRALKCLLRPTANAGIRVGRNVTGINGAKLRRYRQAASVRRTAFGGMTGGTITDAGQYLAFLHQLNRKSARWRWYNGCHGKAPKEANHAQSRDQEQSEQTEQKTIEQGALQIRLG